MASPEIEPEPLFLARLDGLGLTHREDHLRQAVLFTVQLTGYAALPRSPNGNRQVLVGGVGDYREGLIIEVYGSDERVYLRDLWVRR